MTAPKWFQKLRRRKKTKQQQQQEQTSCGSSSNARATAEATTTTGDSPSGHSRSQWPCPPAVSPNRASYYFASADRARQDRELPCAADAALDVRVDVVHRRAGGQRLGGIDAPPGTPELKLRRIVTRTRSRHPAADCSESGSASATTSAATTPSTRARGFHVRRRRRRRGEHGDAGKKGKAAAAVEDDDEVSLSMSLSPSSSLQQQRRRRRRLWLYESLVVVKASSDPERELAESMAEMVVANGIRSSEDLEELLACYLALNAAEHHRAVVAAFRHIWCLLDRHSLLL